MLKIWNKFNKLVQNPHPRLAEGSLEAEFTYQISQNIPKSFILEVLGPNFYKWAFT